MKRMLALWAPVLCFSVISCTKDPVRQLTDEESQIYITNYDTTARFNTYTTFSLADSVAVVVDNQLQRFQRNGNDAQAIEAVANALEARGFVRVSRGQNPDLGIAISRMTYTQNNLVSFNDYYDFYGGYWDPYFWGTPGLGYGAPIYYGVYQTSETLLMIDMFDLKNSAQNNQIRSVWSGMIRGSGIFNGNSITNGVTALFNQSPYLKRQ